MELRRGIGTNQVSHSRAGILCLRPCLGLKGPHGLFLVEALKSNFLLMRERVQFSFTF